MPQLTRCDLCNHRWQQRTAGTPPRCPACGRPDYNPHSPYSQAALNGSITTVQARRARTRILAGLDRPKRGRPKKTAALAPLAVVQGEGTAVDAAEPA
jgi:hypothetical protein